MVLKLRDRILASAPGTRRPMTGPEMIACAKGVDLATLDLAGYRQFRKERYARNTVFLNEHVELVVICWMAGQASSIHDHGVSNCLYLVVEGTMKEELFRVGSDGAPVAVRERFFAPGQITFAGPKDVHRIQNSGERELVTLHLYSPPLGEAVRNFTPVPTYA